MSPKALIAVVDDDASVRKAIFRALREADYEVMQFAAGEEFLSWAADTRPDCVVLDIHMPGLTGFEVEARLREEGADVPVIFITAADGPALREQARASGAAHLLAKPFSMDVLNSVIDCVLT